MMIKTFKFKLYRSKRTRWLDRQLWIACKVYNHCVSFYRHYWRLYHKSLNKFALQKHITKIKKLPRYKFWNGVLVGIIQNITDRIELGYRLFWASLKRKQKTAPPKFKSWRNYRSFAYHFVGSTAIQGNTIRIAGRRYKFFKSRDIEGKVKLLTLKRDNCGDFFVCIDCDVPDVKKETRLGESIGFDFGFKGKMLIAEKPEDDIIAPAFFKKQENAIARAYRKLSTKKMRSNNRKKAHIEFARIHRKVVNQRNAFHWRLAQELCRKYAVICFENLNLRWMKRGNHGKKVAEYGFANFLTLLEYVATHYGTVVIRVDRFFPSSQLCDNCGFQNEEVKDVRIREWDCPHCGMHHDRDRNAARNIHKQGLNVLKKIG